MVRSTQIRVRCDSTVYDQVNYLILTKVASSTEENGRGDGQFTQLAGLSASRTCGASELHIRTSRIARVALGNKGKFYPLCCWLCLNCL